ncbi:MAG TPA: SRPBCC family protein [Gaiellaceae bacterium]
MVRVELTVQIARPANDVFALLTDVDRVPEWQASAVASHADEPIAEGVRIHERRHFLGHDAHTELEVTAFVPGRRFALRTLRGPVKLSIDHELVERDGGTSLHVTAEGKPQGLLRLAGPAVTARARQELHRDFERLKAILEE